MVVRRIMLVLMGMIAAVTGWEAVQAFYNSSFIQNGTSAGISLAVFSVGLFIVTILMIPRGE